MPDLKAATTGGSAALLGCRSDWHLQLPSIPRPRPGAHWLGPIALLATVAVPWLAFSGAAGDEGNVAFGLYLGSASIVLMAWSFVLALRISALEPLFGGLGSMYLHTQAEPEIEGGIRGASRSVADSAQDLAGTGQTLLYILVGISLVRWIPYRWWRLSHKFLGISFMFACWHFFTAEKTYANNSDWGIFFGAIVVAGIAAWVLRVVVRDALLSGVPHKVSEARLDGTVLELALRPAGTPLNYKAGQFAVLKVQARGLSEPHVFTIASSPDADELRFFIRDLGDWTGKLRKADLVDTRVLVEGPYGRFEPTVTGARTVWVAGGVGITPFLSAIDGLEPVESDDRPCLYYCVRVETDAAALDVLRGAEAHGRIHLILCDSAGGNRFNKQMLTHRFGPGGLAGAHVALCGPSGPISAAEKPARSLGATRIEKEDFDIRQGFGPDLSRQIDNLWPARRSEPKTPARNWGPKSKIGFALNLAGSSSCHNRSQRRVLRRLVPSETHSVPLAAPPALRRTPTRLNPDSPH
ncbi:MAG: putative ferric reductase [Candidatus Poriferisodalaceae bacterium]|jgi:predicted ferric reductase